MNQPQRTQVEMQLFSLEQMLPSDKQRPQVAEFPNADGRNRNLRKFQVRGIVKAKLIALWHAMAFNFQRLLDLKPELA